MSDDVTTTVHRAIKRMDQEDKQFYRGVGLKLSGFCIVTPVIAEIALQVFQPDGPGLWWGLWAFCGIGALGGICFMSEKIGDKVLAFVSKIAELAIPAALKAKYPPREGPRE